MSNSDEIKTGNNELDGLLREMIGCQLCYGIKSPDTELYDFGFGCFHSDQNVKEERFPFVLHVLCPFKVIKRSVRKYVKYYDSTTSYEQFSEDVQPLCGLKIKRIALGEENDLWIDYGEYWMVFLTYQDGEESWRLFTPYSDLPHWVASDISIEKQ